MSREKADPHLRDLAYEVLEPFSRDFLVRSGLATGLSVLEAGCGAGAMTPWLAKEVGPQGNVVALDVSASALETAEQRVRAASLDNVEFVQQSVHDVPSLGRSFDLVYSRFLLMQLERPAETLAVLAACLRPGGIVALDEPNQAADFAVPPCPPCAAANRVFLDFGDRTGRDFRIGDALFPMLRRLGLEILVARSVQPILPIGRALQMFKHGLLDSVAPLTGSGVIDERELDRLVSDLDGWTWSEGDYYALSRQVQVSGRRS
jgi:SAM-dependent methyltransferase